MNPYHKIPTVWKRDPATKHKALLAGEWATPELAYLAANEWQWTEKVDGTNIRVMWDGEAVRFGGKTFRAQLPAKLVEHLQATFTAQAMAAQFPDGGACLYGEGYGAGIQKGGGYYGREQRFVLFDVKVGDWWLQEIDVKAIGAALRVPVVPCAGVGTLHEMIRVVQQDGLQSAWGPFAAEGIVARPLAPLFARNGDRIICKVKTRDFRAGGE